MPSSITREDRETIIRIAVRCYESNRQIAMIEGPVCRQVRTLLSSLPYLEDMLIELDIRAQAGGIRRSCVSFREEGIYLGQRIYSIDRQEYQGYRAYVDSFVENIRISAMGESRENEARELVRNVIEEIRETVYRPLCNSGKLYCCGDVYKHDDRYILMTNISKDELNIYKEAVDMLSIGDSRIVSSIRYDNRIYDSYGKDISSDEDMIGGYAVIMLREVYSDDINSKLHSRVKALKIAYGRISNSI